MHNDHREVPVAKKAQPVPPAEPSEGVTAVAPQQSATPVVCSQSLEDKLGARRIRCGTCGSVHLLNEEQVGQIIACPEHNCKAKIDLTAVSPVEHLVEPDVISFWLFGQRRMWAWLPWAAALSVGGLIAVLAWLLRESSVGVEDQQRRAADHLRVAEQAQQQAFEPIRFPMEMLAEVEPARNAITAFHALRSVEERAGHVRHGDTLLLEMQRYYAHRELEPRVAVVSRDIDVGRWRDKTFVFGYGQYVLEEEGGGFQFLMEKNGSRYLVDWKHLVGYCEMEWREFLKRRPAEPVECRVLAVRDDYYNFAYPDPRSALCFRLRDREDSGTCYGYVAIQSPAARLLSELMPDPDAGEHPITVRLAFEAGTHSEGLNQAVVTHLVRTDWADLSAD